MLRAHRWLLAAALLTALPAGSFAAGDDYPNRTIKTILGGASDAALRIVADKLQHRLGQPVVVEARPGGGGASEIAVRAVSSAPPDGYTLLMSTPAQTIGTAMQVANFDLLKEFEPVAMLNLSTFILVVNPTVPAHNLKELIAYARANPGKVNCAYAGYGSPQHLSCGLFAKLANANIVLVPYRDAASMANAILGKQVDMLFSVAAAIEPQITAGNARALAVTQGTRSRLFPDLPTMAEAGLSEFKMSGFSSLLAPAKTPAAIVTKLNKEVIAAESEPGVSALYDKISLEVPPPLSPEQTREFLRDDIARWNRAVDLAGIKRGQP
jgi:tripartite-type tricarboxylate transporter receptor subunit TctC